MNSFKIDEFLLKIYDHYTAEENEIDSICVLLIIDNINNILLNINVKIRLSIKNKKCV